MGANNIEGFDKQLCYVNINLANNSLSLLEKIYWIEIGCQERDSFFKMINDVSENQKGNHEHLSLLSRKFKHSFIIDI